MRKNALALLLFLNLLFPPAIFATQTVDLEDQVRSIAAELRCPVCQNLSVADSPSELAQQMRSVIIEQLKEGKTPDQIRSYFVSKYGEWVLLAPTPKGFNLVIWLFPLVAITAGIVLVVFVAGRWVKRKKIQPAPVDPVLIERIRREAAVAEPSEQAFSPGTPLQQEQKKIYGYLKELEFDYQAGRISEEDFQDLRRRYESQAALVLKEIDASSSSTELRAGPLQAEKTGDQEASGVAEPHQTPKVAPAPARRGWRLAGGGIFLVLFGIAVGFLLNQSLRPRASERDSITGDFLTGTAKDLPSYLDQGRAAFDRQEWSQAIAAFKSALAIDPKHPEAHAYMGLILAQAGHADGALLAFDRALSSDPNFPLALWGKGMLLYRAKEDYAGARETLERLVQLSPPGEERNQIQKTIDELASLPNKRPEKKAEGTGPRRTQGIIFIAPELKSKFDAKAVLFIIARAANSTAGPPLAVKRIDRPVFPVTFSLGAEDVMISGMQLAGRITISARLDKDGNPMTREPGDLLGEYRNNPVEIGSQKVDIVIDREN